MAVLATEVKVSLTVEPASEAVAVLVQAKVWTVAVPFDSESSSVHPAGPVTVGLTELTVATRTITSPSSTDAGTVTVGAVLLTLVAATAPNSTLTTSLGSNTFTSWVAVSVSPSSSVTVRVTV